MKSLLFLICVFSFSLVSGQISTQPINIGFSFKLHSNILNEERTIMVALPDGYNSTDKNYPVFYLVDGQWNFNLTVQAISVLANNNIIPRMIIVGIHTGEKRERDLLPVWNEESKSGGGADKLLGFIKEELMPFIESNYQTYPYRVLAGTSYGGVFVMNAIMKDPQLFTAYLTLSPSMWWNSNLMLKRTEDFLIKKPVLSNYLYLTVANEGLDMGVNSLAKILEENALHGLIWKFDEYPEEIHGTICYKGTYNGLKFIFADWQNEQVQFETKGGLLSQKDSVIITINSNSKTIQYTLDGSEPTISSPLYQKQIVVKKPTTIKVFPFYGFGIPGNPDSLKINYMLNLKPETNFPNLKNGLKYSYYEGDWNILPNFDKLTPISSGITTNIKLDERKKETLFSFQYSGLIDIVKDNIYNFYLSSDDGSKFYIGDNLIINNDGLHANIEKNGRVYLQKGKHRITVLFMQSSYDYQLKLEYESSEILKQQIPDSIFYYNAN
ncbi:MAG: alpha/beta hydrolase-fold protein [bacterium]